MNPGITLYRSNSLEHLANELAGLLGEGEDPFRPDWIVVPGRGVARWLSLQIATRAGIAMNREQMSLPGFMLRVLTPYFDGNTAFGGFSGEDLSLPIYFWLTVESREGRYQALEALRRSEPVSRWCLAREIGSVLVKTYWHRPEKVEEWVAKASSSDWMGAIWNDLAGSGHVPPPLPSPKRIAERIDAEPAAAEPIPVFVFHPGRIPRRVLEVMAVLGRRLYALHLFMLVPTRHYHGDQMTRSEAARRRLPVAPDENALLAALGRLDRDLADGLIEVQEQLGVPGFLECDLYGESGARGMLGAIQNGLLEAEGSVAAGGGAEGDDPSLTVHSCHSPLREVEVLHHAVLDFLNTHADAAPTDVLVLAPDMNRYAPLVDAVFSSADFPGYAIPFSIADRPAMVRYPVVEALLGLLSLPGERCTAPAIHDVLSHAAVRGALGFTLDDVEVFRSWIDRSGVRWGIDKAHRQRICGVELDEETTWRAGLDRLVVGMAVPGEPGAEFKGIVPCEPGPSSNWELLGRFFGVVELILEFSARAQEPRLAADWVDALERVIRGVLATPAQEDTEGVRAVFEVVGRLRSLEGRGETIPAEILRRWVERVVADPPARSGVLTGGVSFAPLRAGRMFPARMVAILGLNEGAFPRAERLESFDPLAAERRQGDPSLRDDDRAAFLEGILSARERLHLSYCGRSINDNSPMPPALPLGELIEEIAARRGGASVADTVIRHPLHSFSAAYFDGRDARLFSYSASDARVAGVVSGRKGAGAGKAEDVGGWAGDLRENVLPVYPEPSPEERHLSVDGLIAFLASPLATFAKLRLGIDLREENGVLEAREPLAVEGLDRYLARSGAVTRHLEGCAGEKVRRELLANARIPLGTPGAMAFERLWRETNQLMQRLGEQVDLNARELPVPLFLELDDWTLTGTIPATYGGALVHLRVGDIRPRDRIRAWVYHLVQSGLGAGPTYLAAGPPAGLLRIDRSEDWRQQLTGLVALYREGTSRPVPFHAGAAWAYVNESGKLEAPARARKAFSDAESGGRDAEVAFYRRFFGTALKVEAGFERYVEALFRPLVQGMISV